MSPDGQDGARRRRDRRSRSARSRCPPGTRLRLAHPRRPPAGLGVSRASSPCAAAPRRGCCRRRARCGSPRGRATRRCRRARRRCAARYLRPSMCSIAVVDVHARRRHGPAWPSSSGTWSATTSSPRSRTHAERVLVDLLEPVAHGLVRRAHARRRRGPARSPTGSPRPRGRPDARRVGRRRRGERPDAGARLRRRHRPPLRALAHAAAPARRDGRARLGGARRHRRARRGLRVGRARSSRPSGARRGSPRPSTSGPGATPDDGVRVARHPMEKCNQS